MYNDQDLKDNDKRPAGSSWFPLCGFLLPLLLLTVWTLNLLSQLHVADTDRVAAVDVAKELRMQMKRNIETQRKVLQGSVNNISNVVSEEQKEVEGEGFSGSVTTIRRTLKRINKKAEEKLKDLEGEMGVLHTKERIVTREVQKTVRDTATAKERVDGGLAAVDQMQGLKTQVDAMAADVAAAQDQLMKTQQLMDIQDDLNYAKSIANTSTSELSSVHQSLADLTHQASQVDIMHQRATLAQKQISGLKGWLNKLVEKRGWEQPVQVFHAV